MQLSPYWFGDEASLLYVIEAYSRYLDNPALYPPKLYAGSEEEDEDDPAYDLIDIQNGVGFLKVSGPLVARESFFDRYFGISSYPAIGRAVNMLASKYEAGEIHSIIHTFSTQGGDASGIGQLSETMKEALKRAPNTSSWTGTNALSAGYWLAATNPSVRADKMAELGSIGAVTAVMSVYKRMQENGVDVKVLRGGKNKALNHPYEPLSERGLAETQKKIDQLHGFFLEHVLSSRPGLTLSSADKWGDGSTFFAEEAIQLGLADGPPISLASLANQLVLSNNLRNSNPSNIVRTFGDQGMTKKVVFQSEEDRARVASGVDLSQVPHTVIDEDDETPTPEPTAELQAPAEPQTAAAAPSQAPEGDLVTFLRTELKAAQEQLMALSHEKADLGAKLQALASVEITLAPLVIESIQRLQVGLNQTPMNLAGLPAATLAEQYVSTRDLFERRYPAGRRSLAESNEDRQPVDMAESRLSLVK